MYLILMYTIVFLGSIFRKKDKFRKISEGLYFLTIWLFASTSMNGKDKLVYEGIFNAIDTNNIKSIFNQKVIEKGYYFFNFIVKKYNGNFIILLTVITLLTTVINFKAFRYYTQKFNLTLETILLVYLPTNYISGQMGALRQSIAISIFFFSFKYILEKNLLKYSMWIIIAYFFHKSALFLLIIPIIYSFKKKKRKKIILFTNIFIFIFMVYLKKSGMIYNLGKLSLYAKGISYGLMGTIERVIFLILVLNRYRNKNLKGEEKVLLDLYCLYFFQVFVFDTFFAVMYRIRMYYFSIFSILFPILLRKIRIKKISLDKIILYLYGIFVALVFMSSTEVKEYFIPYRNYLFLKDNYNIVEKNKIKETEDIYKYFLYNK